MRKKPNILSAGDLREIARRRADARKRALEYANAMTDEEDARLTAAAEADPDNPPITEEQWRRMRPAYLVRPELVARQLRRERGRPKAETTKQQVTLRIDRDVLDKFRATGAGWQSRINSALRKAVKV